MKVNLATGLSLKRRSGFSLTSHTGHPLDTDVVSLLADDLAGLGLDQISFGQSRLGLCELALPDEPLLIRWSLGVHRLFGGLALSAEQITQNVAHELYIL